MIVQIYEITSPHEAAALGDLGVDHIVMLVGDGSFPRERSIDDARLIFSAIPSSSKGLALLLTSDVRLIRRVISELKPAIVHLGAPRPICSHRRRSETSRSSAALSP